MNKTLYAILILLFTINSYSQDLEFEEFKNNFINKMSTEMCDCVNRNKSRGNEEIMKCLDNKEKQFGPVYDSLFIKISQKKSRTYVETVNNNIFFSLQEIMVRDCKNYSAYFRNLRENTITKFYDNANKKKLDSLYNVSVKNADYFQERAMLNFAAKNFDNAIKDLRKAITLSNYFDEGTYLLLAWIYYEKGDLNGSIKIYNEFLDVNRSPEMKAFLEITKIESINK